MQVNPLTDKFLWAFMAVSLLWTFIIGTVLSPDGIQSFQKGLIHYLAYNAAIFLGFSGIILLASLIFYGVGRLFKKTLSFPKMLFVTAVIFGLMSIGGSIIEKSERKSPQTFSESTRAPIQQPLSSESIENFGDSSFYQSATDNFVAFFPQKPSIEKAKANYLTVRSYQASEILQNEGFVFYSITFSIVDYETSLAMSRNEAINYLNRTLDQFRNSSGTTVSGRYIKRPTNFIDFPALEYKFDFVKEGTELCNQGVFFLNKNRIVRISISFPKAAESAIKDKYEFFKNSFALIDK